MSTSTTRCSSINDEAWTLPNAASRTVSEMAGQRACSTPRTGLASTTT
ncbi:hypothetical protein [Streptomyces sp. NPDC049916]